jgi:hypothetical protein
MQRILGAQHPAAASRLLEVVSAPMEVLLLHLAKMMAGRSFVVGAMKGKLNAAAAQSASRGATANSAEALATVARREREV